jgi:small subunit ribosomal protein S6
VIDYEILLMLDPELSEEQQGVIIARTRELIETSGGTVDRHDAWGRRKLAYEINKKGEGTYHLLLFSCAAETLDEVSRVLKIDDMVMRHMATRRSHGVPVDIVGPPPPAPPEPAPFKPAPFKPAPPEPVAVAAPASEDVADDPVVASEPEEAAPEVAAGPTAEAAAEPAEEEE